MKPGVYFKECKHKNLLKYEKIIFIKRELRYFEVIFYNEYVINRILGRFPFLFSKKTHNSKN